jgi:creatinine amidohydrolase
MNSHGGNDFKQILREVGTKFPKMFLCSCNWWQSLNKKDFFEHDGDHADEMETSLILHLAPDLVLPLAQAGIGKEKKIKIKSLLQSWVWTERKWHLATEDTGIGYPGEASKEKGEKYFNAIVDKMSQLFIEVAKADLNDLYE